MNRILAMILCCLLLAGCSREPAETTGAALAPEMTTPPAAVTEEAPTLQTVPPETTGTVEHFITLYAPNEDATGFIYASFEVPEVSPDIICDALIEARVLKEDVAFHSLVVENGQVKLDVNEAFGLQLMSYGTAGEYMMMGSVVNTLLSAYGAETLSITMEGGILESGHVIYDFPLEFHE